MLTVDTEGNGQEGDQDGESKKTGDSYGRKIEIEEPVSSEKNEKINRKTDR